MKQHGDEILSGQVEEPDPSRIGSEDDVDAEAESSSKRLGMSTPEAVDEVIGKSFLDFLSVISKQLATEKALPELFLSGPMENVPIQMTKKDGTLIDVEINVPSTPIRTTHSATTPFASSPCSARRPRSQSRTHDYTRKRNGISKT